MSVLIKICGISDTLTLNKLSELSFDFIGFVHHPGSPRHVELSELTELINSTPDHVQSVVVTVNPSIEFLSELFSESTPDYIQLHGGETAEYIAEIKERFHCKVIKSISIAEQDDLDKAEDYAGVADMILFDTKTSRGSGGTGQSFDWNILRDFESSTPWMLSGGLSAQNVMEAIRITNAKAIDASSHLESPAGSGDKDIEKIKEFIGVIRSIG